MRSRSGTKWQVNCIREKFPPILSPGHTTDLHGDKKPDDGRPSNLSKTSAASRPFYRRYGSRHAPPVAGSPPRVFHGSTGPRRPSHFTTGGTSMSLIAEVKRETNEERLTKAGVYLNYVPADKRELLNALNDREVELLIGLKRRF